MNISQRIGVLSREMAAGESVTDRTDDHQTLRDAIFFFENFLPDFSRIFFRAEKFLHKKVFRIFPKSFRNFSKKFSKFFQKSF